MKNEQSITTGPSRRRITRRIGAAGLALVAAFALSSCHRAAGIGTIGISPVDMNPLAPNVPDDLPPVPVVGPNGKAYFAFTYYCNPKDVNGRVYTYWDTSTRNLLYRGLKITGKVERTFIDDDPDPLVENLVLATRCEDMVDAQVAQFEGSYKSLEKKHSKATSGRFTILVFDQRNPSLPAGDFTGDGFSIELMGGPHNLYTRAGYIDKGEIYAE